MQHCKLLILQIAQLKFILSPVIEMNRCTKDDNRTVILDSINEGVFTVGMDWRITVFNRAAERITGIAREDELGRMCSDVFLANICEKECAAMRTF